MILTKTHALIFLFFVLILTIIIQSVTILNYKLKTSDYEIRQKWLRTEIERVQKERQVLKKDVEVLTDSISYYINLYNKGKQDENDIIETYKDKFVDYNSSWIKLDSLLSKQFSKRILDTNWQD
jgi:predicted Holliday junction resolvase-like endonuclease